MVKRKTVPFYLPLLGRFNVLNALAAIAVGLHMGLEIRDIAHRLMQFRNLSIHMEKVNFRRKIVLINDFYNANPKAVKSALEEVSDIAKGRFKVVILGDMMELGEKAIDFHQEIGYKVASLSYDLVITVGDLARYIALGAVEKGITKKNVFSFKQNEKESLANLLMNRIPENSIVLVKGSRQMKMENIITCWEQFEQKRMDLI